MKRNGFCKYWTASWGGKGASKFAYMGHESLSQKRVESIMSLDLAIDLRKR
jgi:hypothetical protein